MRAILNYNPGLNWIGNGAEEGAPNMCAACGVADHIPTVTPAPPVARAGGAKFAALRHPDCRFYLFGTMLSMVTTPSAQADGFCRNARPSGPRLLGKAQSEPQSEDLAC